MIRSRTDLLIENAMLRQQLIILNRQVKRPSLSYPIQIGSGWSCWLGALDFGIKPFSWFSQKRFFAGIETYFISIGDGNRRKRSESQRLPLKRSL
jgi:hypothetical protein